MKKPVVASLFICFVLFTIPAFSNGGPGTDQIPSTNLLRTIAQIMMDGPDKPPFPPRTTIPEFVPYASHVNLDGPDKPPFPPKVVNI